MTLGHVFHRLTATRPPVAVRGEGIYLIGEDGRRYVDACGGAAVSCIGHGHPEIAAAIAEQTARLEFIHTGFFTSAAAEELAALIAEMSPGPSTGSGSREAARRRSRPPLNLRANIISSAAIPAARGSSLGGRATTGIRLER